MKLSLPSSVPVLLLALVIGCKSTGVDSSSATVSSLEDIRDALSQSAGKVDAVVDSLDALAAADGDLEAHWGAFDKAVSAVESDSKRVSDLRDRAKETKAEYLRGWEERMATIQDDDLRKRAELRRDAATDLLGDLSKQVDEARDSYAAWMVNVTDIRTYLESDLNVAGVNSVADKIEKVGLGAGALKSEINDVVGSLDQVIEAIDPANAPEEDQGE